MSDRQDISQIEGMRHVEEIVIRDNAIKSVSSLSNMVNMKRIDLSKNWIKDISPICDMNSLVYADFSNNLIDTIPRVGINHTDRWLALHHWKNLNSRGIN